MYQIDSHSIIRKIDFGKNKTEEKTKFPSSF